MAAERLTKWLGEHRVGGKVAARIGRIGDDCVAEFAQVGTLHSDRLGTRRHFETERGVDPELVEKLDASLVSALVRHLHGGLTLHGAAIALHDRVVALVGPSGSGKSTLVATLCRGRGADLVADDTVALELPHTPVEPCEVVVHPTQTVNWLLPSSHQALGWDPDLTGRTGKIPVAPHRRRASPVPLSAIVQLIFDDLVTAPALRVLRGSEAFWAVAGAAIRFVLDEPDVLRNEFDQIRILAASCRIFELRRPRDFVHLVSTAQLIEALAAAPTALPRGTP